MLLNNTVHKGLGLILTVFLLLLFLCLSLVYGYTSTTWNMTFESFIHFNHSNEHIIIQSVRLPRAFIAAAVGASLAVSGVLMQTLTKNPLASPDILGINAGASMAIVLTVTFIGINNLQAFTWIAFLGAAIASISVYAIGSAGGEGLTPMKLTLAGSAMAALFASLTQGLLVSNETALDQVLFWLAGSVSGRKLENLTAVLPYLVLGMILAQLLSGKMNVFSMGEDVAKGLGLKTILLKLGMGLVVIMLAGGSVAVAGPIGFIGIVIPHLTRYLVGNDHRWVIPYSALLGAILLLAADIASRYVMMPKEVPVGIMTAIIGTPFFIYIARKGFNNR